MRKMTYITIFVVIVSAAVVLNLKKKGYMLLPEKIEQLMNSTPMKYYKITCPKLQCNKR